MNQAISIAGRAPWLKEPALQRLLAALSAGGEEARIVGGAVRNVLLDLPAGDIDIATTTQPDETVKRVEKAGFRAIPTGIEHGTVTAVADGAVFEVTTLRTDVATDGRHAEVRFGTDWEEDARRRDFTINALYADADGRVFDLIGGLPDLETRTIRFIGDARARIEEDYLRILRFFRFFAWYGHGRPDADGLRACAAMKGGMDRLSAERVWAELRKLLAAPDPHRALLWMRTASVLTTILPESEKWGIDLVGPLVETGRNAGWAPDPLLRLLAMLPPDEVRITSLAGRLKLANAERDRLLAFAFNAAPSAEMTDKALKEWLYRQGQQAVADRLRLALASARSRAGGDDAALVEAGRFAAMIETAESWPIPQFPLRGADLLDAGIPAGPEIGERLKAAEEAWIASGFSASREDLLAQAQKA
ncbi:CCA tRNA nucleotidyltransferase [Notoacmeibacter sp. MSK16QG-6]|uniref:CCA tRNA nucleotidyltransferase n=1 Tax=Notoacmeibacter sp. MSK16QG-6 TaxID=2957982 RepID=UPI00209F1501|nr:CCA tRNA nucleotidyltransferase [Notoacmeibacter sp. MSK16QG-6]MCP1199893.1 CCA tRNA nucleotidyltransferase [Notoacmeibacter sp. MSK16QG-6]